MRGVKQLLTSIFMTKNDELLIMNANEEEVDLGLALDSTSYNNQSRSKSSSGAGVNANMSSADMAFAASDPLSELVWLPHKGLSLKCADSSSTGQRPFHLWNVQPSSRKLVSPPQIMRPWGPEHDTVVNFPGTMINVDDESRKIENMHPTKISEVHLGSPSNIKLEQDRENEVTSATGDVNVDSVKMLDLTGVPPVKLECTAENDLQDPPSDDVGASTQERPLRGNSLTVEKSPTESRIQLYLEKGKGKVLLDENGRSRDDEDEGGESAESCNSVGLFSKGVKRLKGDQELIIESKRMKKEIASTSIVNHDSSFMNWISNMVKGVQEFNKEIATPSLALTLARSDDFDHQEAIKFEKNQDPENRNLGFQAMFQSLYRSTAKIPRTGDLKENYSTGESDQRVVADEALLEKCPRSDEKANLPIPRDIVGPITMPHKSSALSSLWITRLSLKTPELENCNCSSEQILECSTDRVRVNSNPQISVAFPINQKSSREIKSFGANFEASVSDKSSNRLNPILPPPEFETSETMASVFARRLEALRHIIPSDNARSSTSAICFFCGRVGHNLRECPEVTESELEDLVQKSSLFNKVEESSSLCLRCSQFDHWAITCPLASSTGHCQLKQSASFLNFSSRLMFCSGNENCSDYTPSNLMWGVNEFLGKRTVEVEKSIPSNSHNEIKEDENFALYKVRGLQNDDAPVEMFNAIRKLRLSRVDILRWMKSPISESQLNGFFLRLRLGKWRSRSNRDEILPAELGKAGYYVTCITGAQRENSGGSSKNSVFADVEGINYSVESQYVSNHDFSEDEIRAWWSRIVKGGGKIPSLDELNSKLEERKVLGF